MSNDDSIKNALFSILKHGSNSPFFNSFYNICLNFSIASLCTSRNSIIKNEIIRKLGCSIADLACDCIADLFETRDEKLNHINNCFDKKFPAGIEHVHPDILTVHLAALVKSKTNQQISEIREKLGDHYYKIKKALSTFLKRKSDLYTVLFSDGIKYISFNHVSKANFTLPQINYNEMLSKILLTKFKNNNLATVLPKIFEILQNQDEYCKAIREKHLLELLKEFYQIKQNDFIRENVEYINIEDFYNSIIKDQNL